MANTDLNLGNDATASNNLKLRADGAGGGSINNGAGTALATFLASGGLSGSIKQIVSTAKTDTFTTAATSYTDITGMSVSITPSSTSSRILVLAFFGVGNSSAGNVALVQLMRDVTAIAIGDAASSRTRAGVASIPATAQDIIPSTIVWVDSPATVAATTYKLQMRAGSTGTVTFGRSGSDADTVDYGRVPGIIIAVEIAG